MSREPSPSSYTFSVPEIPSSTLPFGTVSATDADNDIMGYSITAGDPNADFSIDWMTGGISVAGMLDYEDVSRRTYTLTVTVGDMEANTATATVTVNVTDVLEDPIFSPNTYSFSVAENAGFGVAVGTPLSATDPQNDITGYFITAGDPNMDFSIDSTGQIKVAGTLDYEDLSRRTYTLTVEVQDMYGHSDTATVTVNVTDVAENPIFSPNTYSFSVAEDAAFGADVGTPLSATDPQNDIMGYSITAGDPNSDFSINSAGQIEVAGTLDYEDLSRRTYTLTVEVQDMDGHYDTATVTVNVTDIDESPQDLPGGATDDDYDVGQTDILMVSAAEGLGINDVLSAGVYELLLGPPASEGTITVEPDGAFTFDPADGFDGECIWTYKVTTETYTAQATVKTRVWRVNIEMNLEGVWGPVTNGTTSLFIGEQVNVRAAFKSGALTSPPALSTYQWTIPGIIEESYTETTGLGAVTHVDPSDLQCLQVVFFWVDQAVGRVVTFDYAFPGQGLVTLQTTVNVYGPTITATATPGAVRILIRIATNSCAPPAA